MRLALQLAALAGMLAKAALAVSALAFGSALWDQAPPVSFPLLASSVSWLAWLAAFVVLLLGRHRLAFVFAVGAVVATALQRVGGSGLAALPPHDPWLRDRWALMLHTPDVVASARPVAASSTATSYSSGLTTYLWPSGLIHTNTPGLGWVSVQPASCLARW
jgi:hypothetical protein